jgi:hypothetical protein
LKFRFGREWGEIEGKGEGGRTKSEERRTKSEEGRRKSEERRAKREEGWVRWIGGHSVFGASSVEILNFEKSGPDSGILSYKFREKIALSASPGFCYAIALLSLCW